MEQNSSIHYGETFIDRCAELRRDHNHLMDQIHSEYARIIPVHQDQSLIQSNAKGVALEFLETSEEIVKNGVHHVFLGKSNDQLIYTLDLSDIETGLLTKQFPAAEFSDLRQVGALLNPLEASIANYSRGILYWHKTHQFCHRCGCRTVSTEGGHSRTCTDRHCAHITYPRISPAVIVLVEHRPKGGSPPKCLLGKGHRSWGNIRSTLAGFVEVGETLEEAVRREMKEEAGIEVHNIRYMGSQPWPFPSSLMVGFYAETDETELHLDNEEILEADWYTVEEMKKQVASGELVLSREDSIARYLIEDWISRNP